MWNFFLLTSAAVTSFQKVLIKPQSHNVWKEAKRTSPGRGKKWSICKFTPEANEQVAVLLYSKVFIFRWQYQQIFPMGRIFFRKRFGGHDLEWTLDTWKNTEFALSIVKKYTLYICLVVTSDYLRVSNHAIMVFGVTTFYFKL